MRAAITARDGGKMQMTKRVVSTIVAALVCVGGAAPAAAALVFTPLDHPLAGAGGTTPYDIDGDRIVGSYLDAAQQTHGFVYQYQSGNWVTLDHPQAPTGGTNAYGVSGPLICGSYLAPSGQTLGFLYDGTTWTTLEHPPIAAAGGDTFARGLSNGTVVGYYIESAVARGFIYNGGTFTDIMAPLATGTFPMDLDGGRVVGNYDDPLGSHGFVFDAPVWIPVDHPLGELLGTFLTGIDGSTYAGYYLGLPTGAAHGFLFDGGTYLPINAPGATDTTVYGIDGSHVVGTYVDAAGQHHGFVATVPEPSAAVAIVILPAIALGRRRARTVPRSRS